MARYLRQSTVTTIKAGPFVSPTDGLTVYIAGGFTVKLSANGGALAARHDVTAIAHDADGYYAIELDATDTAAVGRLKLEVPGSAGNYLPVWDDFVVLSAAVYDALFGAVALSTYAGADTAGTTTLLARLTATRATGLDNLDAAISTRSTYAGADTAGTTTLLARLTAIRATNLDNLDAAISTRSTYAGADTAGTTTLLARLTAIRATNLDNLDAAISTRSTYAGADTAGTTTLLARLTAIRATNLDNLDVAVSTRSTFSGAVTLDQAAILAAPRALDGVADGATTVGDALWCAVAAAAGREVIVGTSYLVKTPSTGTTIRAFVLDSATAPTSRS